MADLPVVLYWGEIILLVMFGVFGVLLICTVFMRVCECVCINVRQRILYVCEGLCMDA